METNKQLFVRMKSHDTLVCCGLDPDLTRMPDEILGAQISDEDKVLLFMKEIIDLTAPHICAYKAQKAFFDLLPGGHTVLQEVIKYVHENHPTLSVIIDCKIGDIDNTMEAYIENLFGHLKADGIVVNPYMGDDVMDPLSSFPDKAIVALVKTSNSGGSIVQNTLLENGQQMWRYMLDLVLNRWNQSKNMIPVLSSTAQSNFAELRTSIPEKTPILLAGVGAQGGNLNEVAGLLNADGIGPFVNSSRGILYPEGQKPWREGVVTAVQDLKNALNQIRRA